MIETRVAPFSRPMAVLPSGGRAIRIAWGKTTCRKLARRVKPSAVAASTWPRSTLEIAARKVSAVYAEPVTVSAMIAAWVLVNATPARIARPK